METMIAEERFVGIIDAADPDDCDDVEIRTLLAAALRQSGLDDAELSRGRIAGVRTSCEFRAERRAAARVSPRFWRTRRALHHRSR
jgi:hypothetical protein